MQKFKIIEQGREVLYKHNSYRIKSNYLLNKFIIKKCSFNNLIDSYMFEDSEEEKFKKIINFS